MEQAELTVFTLDKKLHEIINIQREKIIEMCKRKRGSVN